MKDFQTYYEEIRWEETVLPLFEDEVLKPDIKTDIKNKIKNSTSELIKTQESLQNFVNNLNLDETVAKKFTKILSIILKTFGEFNTSKILGFLS